MSGTVLFLSATDVERALTMPAAIAAVREAFIELSAGNAEVTLFKSVGNAVQDLAVASVVLSEARRLDLGTEVEL
jgi:ornithine cyclodeaminase